MAEERKMTRKRSLINTYFTEELRVELLKITMISGADNNEKGSMIKKLLTDHGIIYNSLGSGTNRMAVQIDGYAIKFALDKDGINYQFSSLTK